MNRPARPRYRGHQLGLPPSGAGSLAPFGRRILAFVLDTVGSGLVAGLFARQSDLNGAASHLPGSWSLLAFAIDYVLGTLLAGRTIGMWATGLRIVRVDEAVAIGPLRAAARTVLLMLLVPAVVLDADLRGFHDRLTSTAVIVH